MLKISVLRGYVLTINEEVVAKEINYNLEKKQIDVDSIINIQMVIDEKICSTTFYVWYKTV